MLTVPLPLAAAPFCVTRLPVRAAVLNDDPAPPEAVVVAVMVVVWVVICVNVPPSTTELFRAALISLMVPTDFVVVSVLLTETVLEFDSVP
jgi:hypothetical protein